MPHHICSACGYYNGRQWMTPKGASDEQTTDL
jgi:hypothetical protein